jgi:hypothetical protein
MLKVDPCESNANALGFQSPPQSNLLFPSQRIISRDSDRRINTNWPLIEIYVCLQIQFDLLVMPLSVFRRGFILHLIPLAITNLSDKWNVIDCAFLPLSQNFQRAIRLSFGI